MCIEYLIKIIKKINFLFISSFYILEDTNHFVLLGIDHIEKGTNRKIFKYQCVHCTHTFKNHKNAKEHLKNCPIYNGNGQNITPKSTLDDYFQISKEKNESPRVIEPPKEEAFQPFERALMNLFMECSYPYSEIERPAWQEFVNTLNTEFELPCIQTFKRAIIQYSEEIQEESLNDMKDTVCGLAVDGSTFRGSHYYATILIGPRKIRLLRIQLIQKQDGVSLSNYLFEVYKICLSHHITISGVCSDNGPGIKAALTKEHPLYFRALVGNTIFWLSCAAHTAQLAVGDFLNFNAELKTEIQKFLGLLTWLRNREKHLKGYVTSKIPHYVCTRWNTLNDTIEYFMENRENIQQFINDRIEEENEQGEQSQLLPIPFEIQHHLLVLFH